MSLWFAGTAHSEDISQSELDLLLSPLPSLHIQAKEQPQIGDLQVSDYLDALMNSTPANIRRRNTVGLDEELLGPDFIASALAEPLESSEALAPVFLGVEEIGLRIAEPSRIVLDGDHCFYQIMLDSGESRQLFDVVISVSSVDGGKVVDTQDFPFPTLGGSLGHRISTVQFDASCGLDGMRVTAARGFLLPLPEGHDFPINLLANQQVSDFETESTPLVVGEMGLLPGEKRVVSAFDLAVIERQTGHPAQCIKVAFANFRAGVGTHTPVLRTLPEGEVLKVLDITRNKRWLRVETLEGEFGFVHSSVARLCDETLIVNQVPPRPSTVAPRRTATPRPAATPRAPTTTRSATQPKAQPAPQRSSSNRSSSATSNNRSSSSASRNSSNSNSSRSSRSSSSSSSSSSSVSSLAIY